MKSVGDILADKAKHDRHRQWSWCRRPNGFCDMPRWRVIAEKLNVPLPYVIAFVNRLEEFANAAELRFDPRGHVGAFDPVEFGAALGMATDEAARIYAALEQGAQAWIGDDYVVNFHQRNPDREDETAGQRPRRKRARDRILKILAKAFRAGGITGPQRDAIERKLGPGILSDAELFELAVDVSRGRFASHVTRDARDSVDKSPAAGVPLQTNDFSSPQGVTRDIRSVTRDSVTVTPEQITDLTSRSVDNFGDAASGAAEGLPKGSVEAGDPQGEALAWLADKGVKIVAERMRDPLAMVATRVERWLHQELNGDGAALKDVILAADRADYMGLRFNNLVVDGIRQAKFKAASQGQLPLLTRPVPVDKLRSGGRS